MSAATATAALVPDPYLLQTAVHRLSDQLAKLRMRPITASDLMEDRLAEVAREFNHDLLAKALGHAQALVEEHKGPAPRLHHLPGAFDQFVNVHDALTELEELHAATAPYRKAAGLKP